MHGSLQASQMKKTYYVDRKIINLQSGFAEKQLCDGPTFTAGDACVYSCAFCFTESMGTTKGITESHTESIVRRRNPLQVLANQLLHPNGKPKYNDPTDQRVIYGSPLVDVAANIELCKETIEICKFILTTTHWQIRLLSKSNLLPYIAKALNEYKNRVIYGVSTGTPDNNLAKAFECGTALVSKRIESLHWLQDNGFRTYGMLCPSLPYSTTEEYETLSRDLNNLIRSDKCEQVWGEVINVRGESMERTCDALITSGYEKEAKLLREVTEDQEKWEQYSRKTFEAHTKYCPKDKLRYLQYIKPETVAWWKEKESEGAVLLGHIKI